MTSCWTRTSARSSTGAKLTATEIRRRHSALAAVAAAVFVPGGRVEALMNSAARARTSGIYSKDCSAAADARSEEHTSELQSLMRISYAVFCLNKKKTQVTHTKIK